MQEWVQRRMQAWVQRRETERRLREREGAEAEAGAEEALLVYPLDAPSWLDLAEEMCTLLVARGRYATQGSNPRLAGRAPGRPCSATPTVEPLRGQRMTRRC